MNATAPPELATAIDELQLRVSMMQLIPAAVWSVTPDGTPDIVNQGWYDYTGQTPEYVRSQPEAWMTTMHPDDREWAGKIYWDGIRSGSGFTMEARFLRAQRPDLPMAPEPSGCGTRHGRQDHPVRRHVH